MEQVILAGCLLHTLVFGVRLRCSRVCHMCRYFFTLCLYNPSLYHIIVLCLYARESLSTSPTNVEHDGQGRATSATSSTFTKGGMPLVSCLFRPQVSETYRHRQLPLLREDPPSVVCLESQLPKQPGLEASLTSVSSKPLYQGGTPLQWETVPTSMAVRPKAGRNAACVGWLMTPQDLNEAWENEST